ncbi:MAG: hypothetical protein JO001_18600 [Alphaproteobacteria bacterium]|nr:hypothetical protein [Alphaproteobacteria bacterium]
MKDVLSSRNLIKRLHRREKATIDHLVSSIGASNVATPTRHSAFTDAGLSVEEQIRKAWHSGPVGLAVF